MVDNEYESDLGLLFSEKSKEPKKKARQVSDREVDELIAETTG